MCRALTIGHRASVSRRNLGFGQVGPHPFPGRRPRCDGNRESLTNLFRGGDTNAVLWAWRHHATYERRYTAALAEPQFAHLRFIRIRTVAEADPVRVRAEILKHNPNIDRTAS